MKNFLYIFIFIASLALSSVLEPKDAFKIAISGDNQSGIVAKFDIANSVYLYQDKIRIKLDNSDITKILNLPKATKYDSYEIYRDLELFIPAGLMLDKNSFNLDIYYQGCSDDGFCYQPLNDKFEIKFDSNGKVLASKSSQINSNSTKENIQNNQSKIASNLENSSLLWAVGTFFVYGILLCLTPCIFPMIPILSGLLVAKGANSAKSGFIISLIYVLAMSFTYALAGVVASMLGASLQGMLQIPVVLAGFSVIFVVLALSMFGLFELKMPNRWQNYLNSKSSKFGGMSGVIFMGIASALVVGPCVAAPLAGALLYIANSGDMLVGGLALFAMSFGMGLPLLAIGLGGGKILPKPGEWMIKIKILFGFIMLGMAVWIIEPIISREFAMLGYAILGAILAVIFGAFESANSIIQRVIKAISIIIFAISMVVIVDFSFNRLNLNSNLEPSQTQNRFKFEYITNLKDLQEIIKTSQTPLLIDFWASWCVNCKELEESVFTKKDIANKLSEFRLIKIDLTHNSKENQEITKEYKIFGPPVLLIYDKGELKSQITGLISSENLLKILNQI